MNKTIYDAALNIQKTQKLFEDKLEEIGLSFEYGSGLIGQTMEDLVNDSDRIVKESLGLHYKEVARMCDIGGVSYPITIDVLYPHDDDPEWAITEDDFCEFFYQAQQNNNVSDLMWRAIVERDQSAKDKYNALGHGRIGVIQ